MPPLQPLYLDYQATTPLLKPALDAMMPYLTDHYGNPHSASHAYGWRAEGIVEKARAQIAKPLQSGPETITFTSGATEANNLVLKGIMMRLGAKRPHLVTLETEHKCVLETANSLENAGYKVTRLGIRPDGLVDLDRLEDAVTSETALISIMAVNNEIGVIQPLKEIGAIAARKGALVHSDAAQAYSKIPLLPAQWGVSFLSLSGHKLYGPKGVGALWVAPDAPRPVAQIDGGGQEGGLRSGTLAPALVAGFGAAAAHAESCRQAEWDRLLGLQGRFLAGLDDAGIRYQINGCLQDRYPGNINISFPSVDGSTLISRLKNLAVASGAACASADATPSYVLEALNVPPALREATLRIGFGQPTTEADIDFTVAELASVIAAMQ